MASSHVRGFQPVAEALGARIQAQRDLLRTFLLELPGQFRDINTPDSELVFIGDKYAWPELDVEGRRLQSRLLAEHNRLGSLLHVLLRAGPGDTLKDFERTRKEIEGYIDQSHLTWVSSRMDAAMRADNALDTWSELLSRLYDPVEGDPLVVADTNALLWNPSLENWTFPDTPKFEVVLTATVLSELDKLKVEHRDEGVRAKAEGLVRRIKGYRARGRLGEGVPLRRDRTTLRTIALEPDFDDTLPWLDPGNSDDRILAEFVEVMRAYPRTPVVLVTRDINLQNKAENAGLPFIEPPDPPAKRTDSASAQSVIE